MSRLETRLKALEAKTPDRVPFNEETLEAAAESLLRGEPLPRGWAELWSEDQITRMAELQVEP